MRVLMIDDEPVFYKMALGVLKEKGYVVEYANNGNNGLAAIASFQPEIIIVDMRMPDMTGLDVLQKVRQHPLYNQIPIIFVTSVNKLDEKLKAFELGADDYLLKPFEPEELAARLDLLARRAKVPKLTDSQADKVEIQQNIIAVHSLRGGCGVSSIAVNLALSYLKIWEKSTLIIDTALFASQVAMLLNVPAKYTLGKLATYQFSDIDEKMLDELIDTHTSGLQVIAAPRFPVATDVFTDEFWNLLYQRLHEQFSFIVIDTSHDFTDIVISNLLKADTILLVVGPEMASLRVAVSALKTYDQIGIQPQKIKLVLNCHLPNISIDREKIQKALGRKFDFELPYEPTEVLRALNLGSPFVLSNPDLAISKNVEDMAYALSSELLKDFPPIVRSKAWRRVTSRNSTAGKKP